jgi:glycosyltransferase involved in cell wall biosynthesis
MPFRARRPAGGFRVMYEYANRLSALGYEVHITYPVQTKYMKYRFPYIIRLILSVIEGFRTNNWFNFRPEISMSYVNSVLDKYVQDADVVIATWWSTALDMGQLSSSKGKKINLIQGYENWEGHEDLLHSSYNMKDTTNIVVASYIEKIVKKYTENPIVLIPNAIDKEQFNLMKSIQERKSTTICMMYSLQDIKGSEFGLKALEKVKESNPELKVELFGVCPEPENLPDWITFYRNPNDLCDLYNRNAIFISNSLTEGMALTPMEAMFCGCACILTDIEGHSEYGFDNKTALLYEVKNVKQLTEKIIYLLDNDEERILLAKRGNQFIQQFSWDNAVEKMNGVIKQLVNK